MGMLGEFREFAVKGNVIDLAVGVIIGAAFGKIVDSLVGDLIMPLIAALLGRVEFSNLFVVLRPPPPGTAMTLDALKKILSPHFELSVCKDLPFLIREHARKFQLGISEASVWVRK